MSEIGSNVMSSGSDLTVSLISDKCSRINQKSFTKIDGL